MCLSILPILLSFLSLYFFLGGVISRRWAIATEIGKYGFWLGDQQMFPKKKRNEPLIR